MLRKWNFNWRNVMHPLKAFCRWSSSSNHIASKRHAFSIGELEKKGGLVGFHFRRNGMHFGNGIHHP
jgi:hypothetical protein